jgi:hypothetical protein
MSKGAAKLVVNRMDLDKDGKVTFQDFVATFSTVE